MDKERQDELVNLFNVVAEIKDHFILRKNRLPDGKQRSYALPHTKAYSEQFRKAAGLCMELYADPREFVEAQFHNENPDKMLPAFLYSSRAKQKYEDYMALYKFDYKEILSIQAVVLQEQVIRCGRDLKDVLLDKHLQLEPWFRICISPQPIPEVIEKYKEEARAMLDKRLKQFLEDNKLDYRRIIL